MPNKKQNEKQNQSNRQKGENVQSPDVRKPSQLQDPEKPDKQ